MPFPVTSGQQPLSVPSGNFLLELSYQQPVEGAVYGINVHITATCLGRFDLKLPRATYIVRRDAPTITGLGIQDLTPNVAMV